MKLNLDLLEELAKESTQGIWEKDRSSILVNVDNELTVVCHFQKTIDYDDDQGERNLEYVIKLVNSFPSILQHLKAYERAVESLNGMNWSCGVWHEQIDEILSTLYKELE